MTKRAPPSATVKLGHAALRLLVDSTFEDLTVAKVARAAKVDAKLVQKITPTKEALISCLIATIDDETARTYAPSGKNESLNDQLFDVLMTRFEVMESYRPAIQRIAELSRHEPDVALPLVKAQRQGIRNTLELIQNKKITSIAFPALWIIYNLALLRWLKNKDSGTNQVMIVINQGLHRMSKFGLLG